MTSYNKVAQWEASKHCNWPIVKFILASHWLFYRMTSFFGATLRCLTFWQTESRTDRLRFWQTKDMTDWEFDILFLADWEFVRLSVWQNKILTDCVSNKLAREFLDTLDAHLIFFSKKKTFSYSKAEVKVYILWYLKIKKESQLKIQRLGICNLNEQYFFVIWILLSYSTKKALEFRWKQLIA